MTVSRELYLDNAKVYHAHALSAACYSLNIKLLHRPPRDPAPGGLIERFFGTTQTQFEIWDKLPRRSGSLSKSLLPIPSWETSRRNPR